MLKRTFDLLLSAVALIVLSPLLLLIAAAIALVDGLPVMFVQDRPGLMGRPFKIMKFRTMALADSGDADVAPDAQRITRIGRLLRATSLDELPELINVLKGDMSLVGPRPLLMEYLCRYSAEQARRHEVRPGITGWAQINGRNALTWEQKFDLDVWYVDNRSFLLDVKILAATVAKVLRREGISHPGESTMPKFKGKPE